MLRPGPRNLITDVDGVLVGNACDPRVRSGVTVVLPETSAVAAVDVRGGAPGTRETEALDPDRLVGAVDAIVLSGGSVFGLDAASGVTRWLAARGRGFLLRGFRAPIVPAAILFDLANGGDKNWGERPPYDALGVDACAAAGQDFALGNVGAGFGGKAGGLKAGLGSASAIAEDGLAVGALAAVNAWGEAVMPGSDRFWAWALEIDGEFGGLPPPRALPAPEGRDLAPAIAAEPGNTTIAVVATDAELDKAEARRVAIMAQDGLARALRPVHTPFDGDVVFALATGRRPLAAPRPRTLTRIGMIAADCLARAVCRAVWHAEPLGALPSLRQRLAQRV